MRPISIARFFCSALIQWRILLRAFGVATMFSQSRLGSRFGFVVISTMSPFFSPVRNGTSRPLTRAPLQWWPSSVWIR